MAVQTEKNDIIAAIATPKGKGAVSCIRLSGEGSVDLMQRVTNGLPDTLQHGKMYVAHFHARVRDKIMAVAFLHGKSYTGEESAELYFHGGRYLTEQALLGLIDNGARLATAGEFTRRAFLHGKIDLTQAEGIADLIDAESADALAGAYEQSEGRTRQAIEEIYAQAITLAARAEVSIDYPEEDVEEQTREQLAIGLQQLQTRVQSEINGYDGGRIRREGARVVLTGKTNAGKSTLFNTMLREQRAIVSDEDGTTRDTIEEKCRYKDAAFVLVDTAGIRTTQSKAEQMGIQRSKDACKSADVVLHVLRKGEKVAESLDENAVIVVNSFQNLYKGAVRSAQNAGEKRVTVELNAATGEGVPLLQEEIYRRIKNKTATGGAVNNPRQYAALKEAGECLARAQTAVQTLTADCICADLRAALDALGRITGRNVSDSLVDEIFSKFCVGK